MGQTSRNFGKLRNKRKSHFSGWRTSYPSFLRKNGQMNYVTEVLVTGFQLLESRAQRAIRENNAGQDLADLVLEEEELPF